MNQLVARSLFVTAGSNAQQDRYLGDLVQGKLIGTLAVSEPRHGSHPKYLETGARKEGDDFVISGKKTYITNGPIAGVYIVVAVSGTRGGEKAFTAFIVPRDTPGLKVGDPLDLGFLRPCPHGEILLDACRVPAQSVLGSVGDAYRNMIVPFGEIEDVLMMGPVIGVMRAQLTMIRDVLGRDRSRGTDGILNSLGTIYSLIHTLEGIALEACGKLDGSGKNTGLTEMIISSRHLVPQIASELASVVSLAKIQPSTKYGLLAEDLSMAASVAARITEIRRKKLGAVLLSCRGD
ncbi:MAG: acyl-CoA dehydrogenase, partial [Desulfomonilia bacterium]|nr:acyl-CoA dehydrogenase [Desulfomonilia bacterium]